MAIEIREMIFKANILQDNAVKQSDQDQQEKGDCAKERAAESSEIALALLQDHSIKSKTR